jgi:LPXTG-motif cell wall-anchored protein
VPEFPSWIIPTLLLTTMIGAGLLVYFKKRKR